MEKQQMNQDQLLELLNECLYAYVYAENKQVEKQQARNIKQIKKALKQQFNKKVVFNKKELVYVFKN